MGYVYLLTQVYRLNQRRQALIWLVWIARVICFMPMDSRNSLLGIVEACAIRKCEEKAIQHGWRKFYVLSDANGAIDIWNMCASLEHVMFVNIPRRFNVVAHNVAKLSISLLSKFYWERQFPTWIVNDAEISLDILLSPAWINIWQFLGEKKIH